ncbi:MAG: ASPIC/UnbV domain-containing protein [Acidobacteria bacterium]|nr:ASPIC/UnbV domain-containing protein [Acidobacteriota bacterium]
MSYTSASDPRVHFRPGKRTKIESLDITCPKGQVDLRNLRSHPIKAIQESSAMVAPTFLQIASPK